MWTDRWMMVPTNWDPDLLEGLAEIRPAYLYGSLPEESTLRSPLQLPPVTAEAVAEHVEAAAAMGSAFVYVMNATCMGNRELSGEGRWEILQRCQWLSEIGAAGIVLANPLVIELVREAFPELEVHVSVLAEVDSPNAARFYDGLGATVIHVAPQVNRNVPRLRAIRRSVSCRISILANEGCLLECPIRRYHAALLSHSRESIEGGYHVDYCYLRCSQAKLREPAEYLRMPWVRPEDLPIYHDAGVDLVKVAGREKMGSGQQSHTQWILNTAGAYQRGSCDDVAELLVAVEPVRSPFPGASEPDVRVRIDSAKLAGFLDFFAEGRCEQDCARCHYCDEWAASVVSVDGDRGGYAADLDRAIGSVRLGDYRARPGA